MFNIVLQRALLDIWDNLLLAFVGNAILGMSGFLLALSVIQVSAFSPVLATVLAGVLATFFGLAVLGFAAILQFSVRERSFSWMAGRDAIARSSAPMTIFIFTSLAVVALAVTGASLLPTASDESFGVAIVLIVTVTLGWFMFAVFFVPLLATAVSARSATKEAGLLVLHNPGFSLLIAAVSMAFLAMTVVGIPGIAGVLVLGTVGARLRLRRYADGLAATPDWDALMVDEREKLASLNFFKLVFPWRR